MHVLYPPVLFGLVAVLIPPLVYWYARSRPAVVGWGAMRFLRLPTGTRRRLRLETGLRLGLQMTVIALVVLFASRPFLRGTWIARAEGRPPRDVVLLIDNSAAMSARTDGVTAAELAKARGDEVLARMWPGDRVAVFAVGDRLTPLLGRLTADRELARGALELVPPPGGTADWPTAVRAVPAAEVVVITAGANPQLEEIAGAGPEPPRRWALDVTAADWSAAEWDERRGRGPVTRGLRWVALAAALVLFLAERWLSRRPHWPGPAYWPELRPIGSGRSA